MSETGGCCWGQEGSCVEHFLETAFVLLQVLKASVFIWTFPSLLSDSLFVSFSRPLILEILSALQQQSKTPKIFAKHLFLALLYCILYWQSKLLSLFEYMYMKATKTASISWLIKKRIYQIIVITEKWEHSVLHLHEWLTSTCKLTEMKSQCVGRTIRSYVISCRWWKALMSHKVNQRRQRLCAVQSSAIL